MLTPLGVITLVVLAWECVCLLSAQCVNFVCNDGNVVQLSAPLFTLFDFFWMFLIKRNAFHFFLKDNILLLTGPGYIALGPGPREYSTCDRFHVRFTISSDVRYQEFSTLSNTLMQ